MDATKRMGLRRQYQHERKQRQEIQQTAKEAFQWWNKTVETAENAMRSMINDEMAESEKHVTLRDWFVCSPNKFIRFIGDLMFGGRCALDKRRSELVEGHKHQFNRWRITVALGKQQGVSVPALAKELGISVETVTAHLRELAKEMKIESTPAEPTTEQQTENAENGNGVDRK